MADSQDKVLQAKEKAQVTTPMEQTKPGLAFTPEVDIFETNDEITLLVDMPGVKSKKLDIDLAENVLTLDGRVESPEGAEERDVFREYRTGNYRRQFTISDVIDQSKIQAELKDGVLKLRLPKVKAATPRKIEVKS